jgi:hypothetical protein
VALAGAAGEAGAMDPVSLGLAGGGAIVGGIGSLVNRIRGKNAEEEEPEVPSDMLQAYQLYKTLDNMEDVEEALAEVTAAMGRLEMQQKGYYPQVPPGYMPPGYVPPGYVPPGYVPPGYVPQGYVPPGGLYPPGLPPQGLPVGQPAYPAWPPVYVGPAQPAYAAQQPGYPGPMFQPQPGAMYPQPAAVLQPQPADVQQPGPTNQNGGRNKNRNADSKRGKEKNEKRGNRGADEQQQTLQQDYFYQAQQPAQTQQFPTQDQRPRSPLGADGTRPAPAELHGSSGTHAPDANMQSMPDSVAEELQSGVATGHLYPEATEDAAELAVLACAGNVYKLPDSPEFKGFSERLQDASAADTDQTIIIVGATPRQQILLLWSSLSRQQAPLDAPDTELPCGDSDQLALGGPVGVSTTRADERGHALVQRRIAQALDCERLLFQAVEPKNCRFSGTVDTRPQEYQALIAPVEVGGGAGSSGEPDTAPVEEELAEAEFPAEGIETLGSSEVPPAPKELRGTTPATRRKVKKKKNNKNKKEKKKLANGG